MKQSNLDVETKNIKIIKGNVTNNFEPIKLIQ